MDQVNVIKNSNVFDSHRVIKPAGVLPQPAGNNDISVFWDNEILVDVGRTGLCF